MMIDRRKIERSISTNEKPSVDLLFTISFDFTEGMGCNPYANLSFRGLRGSRGVCGGNTREAFCTQKVFRPMIVCPLEKMPEL